MHRAAGILLVSETIESATMLETMLTNAGYRLKAHTMISDDVLDSVALHKPDVVVVKTELASNYLMNQLYNLNQANPKPIVVFTDKSEQGLVRNAIKAGVSAYVVDGLSPARVGSVIEVARARFEQDQSLRKELSRTRTQLDERKKIERAKGIIMKSRNLTEDEAYKALRKLAMDKNQRLIDVANDVISVAEILM